MKRKKITADLDTLIPLLIQVWRKYTKLSGPTDRLQTQEFRKTCAFIQEIESYLDGSPVLNPVQFYTPERIAAYILYHWVIHYQQGLSILGELPYTPRRVVELAAGSAPFAYAALKHGAQEVYAYDQNMESLSLGAEIIGRLGHPISCVKWKYPTNALEGKYDLILLPYTFFELFNNQIEKIAQYIQNLSNNLTEDGYIIIVERSNTQQNKRFLQFRDLLQANHTPIYAPCLWQQECPALKSNSQCYAQRHFEKPYFIQEIQRGSNIFLNSLKMSYLILQHPNIQQQTHPKNLFRVISPALESQTGKRYYLCGTVGKRFVSTPIQKDLPNTIRAFDFLERGSIVSIENARENKEALDLDTSSILKVEAAPGKPVPE